MTCRIPGTLFWFAHGDWPAAAAPPAFCLICTNAALTPGKSFKTRSLSALICWPASGLPVSSIETVTAPLLEEISLIRPNETISRENPGYFTAFNAFLMSSSVGIEVIHSARVEAERKIGKLQIPRSNIQRHLDREPGTWILGFSGLNR